MRADPPAQEPAVRGGRIAAPPTTGVDAMSRTFIHCLLGAVLATALACAKITPMSGTPGSGGVTGAAGAGGSTGAAATTGTTGAAGTAAPTGTGGTIVIATDGG